MLKDSTISHSLQKIKLNMFFLKLQKYLTVCENFLYFNNMEHNSNIPDTTIHYALDPLTLSDFDSLMPEPTFPLFYITPTDFKPSRWSTKIQQFFDALLQSTPLNLLIDPNSINPQLLILTEVSGSTQRINATVQPHLPNQFHFSITI